MSVTIRHVRVAAITSGGPTQTFTVSSGPGTNPVAALVFVNTCITTATEANHSQICCGATDGSRNRCNVISSEHGVANANTWGKLLTDSVVITLNANTGAIDGRATWSAWATDGVTLNWNTIPPKAYFVDVILFFGSIDVYVDHFSTLIDSSKNIGFKPDQIYGCGSEETYATFQTSAAGANSHSSFIFGILNGATQNNFLWLDPDGALVATYPNSHYSAMNTDYFAVTAAGADFTILTPTSTGFTIDPGFSSGISMWFLAIGYRNQVSTSINIIDTPTATGPNPITGMGFKPQFVLEIQSIKSSLNDTNTLKQGAFGFGIFSNAVGNCLANRVDYETGPVNSSTKSRQQVSAQRLFSGSGAIILTGTLTSFDIDGYTKNYTVVDATARKSFYIAVSETIPHGWMDEALPLPLDEGEEVVNYG